MCDAEKTRHDSRPQEGSWVIVAAAFWAHFLSHGTLYSFGVLFIALEEKFGGGKAGVAIIPSLLGGFFYLVGPLGSVLIRRFGCRMVTVIGGLVSSVGFFASTFASSLYVLYVTLGFLAGCGMGLLFLTGVVIVVQHFHKYRSFASGISLSGCGCGSFVFSPLFERLLEMCSLNGTFLVISGILLNAIPCGLMFSSTGKTVQSEEILEEANEPLNPKFDLTDGGKPILSTNDRNNVAEEFKDNTVQEDIHDIDNIAILKQIREPNQNKVELDIDTQSVQDLIHDRIVTNKDIDQDHGDEADKDTGVVDRHCQLFRNGRACMFFLSQLLFYLGFLIPFVYVPDKAKQHGISERNAAWAASTIGISSISGRILLGYLADKTSLDRMCLYRVCLLTAGVSTMLGSLCNTFALLILYGAVYGIATGVCLTLMCVVLTDTVGLELLPEAAGMANLFGAIGSFIGPLFVGVLYTWTGSYSVPFLASGIALFFSGALLFIC